MSKKQIGLIAGVLAVVLIVGVSVIPNRLNQEDSLISNTTGKVLGIFRHQAPIYSRYAAFAITTSTAACVNGAPQVSLVWNATTNASSYSIERRYVFSDSWEPVAEATTNSLIDTSFTENFKPGNYIYRVKANVGKNTQTSMSQSVRVLACSPGETTTSQDISGTVAPGGQNVQQLPPGRTKKIILPPPPVSPPAAPKTTLPPPPIAPPAPQPTPPPPPAAPAATPAPVAPSAPVSSQTQWGVYAGYSATEMSSFDSLVGKQAKINAIFTGWGADGPFPSELKSAVSDKGKTLLIYWEQYGVTLDNIISGASDNYIRQFAASAKSYGGPIILVPFHEMNGDWDPWGGTVGTNTPAKVVSAWKRVKDTFGPAANVKWGWAPNVSSDPKGSLNAIENYYPGDSYVDYVGADGFNFGSPWESFSETFSSTLDRIKAYNKPLYIFSTGSAAGSNKAAWIKDALTVQVPKYNIAGWIWFNENKERDWRVNSDSASLSAFKAALP